MDKYEENLVSVPPKEQVYHILSENGEDKVLSG